MTSRVTRGAQLSPPTQCAHSERTENGERPSIATGLTLREIELTLANRRETRNLRGLPVR